MSSYEFLRYLKKALNIINLKLVGINLIVMEEPYQKGRVKLLPFISKNKVGDDHKLEINGTIWVQKLNNKVKKDKHVIVRIKRPVEVHKFNINSDIAGSLYKYYYSMGDKTPCTLHA